MVPKETRAALNPKAHGRAQSFDKATEVLATNSKKSCAPTGTLKFPLHQLPPLDGQGFHQGHWATSVLLFLYVHLVDARREGHRTTTASHEGVNIAILIDLTLLFMRSHEKPDASKPKTNLGSFARATHGFVRAQANREKVKKAIKHRAPFTLFSFAVKRPHEIPSTLTKRGHVQLHVCGRPGSGLKFQPT